MKKVPQYKLRCKKCNKVFEEISSIDDRNNIKCECGGDTEIIIQPIVTHFFVPFFHPNLTSKPVYVKSKAHLKQLDRKYNMTSYY